MQLKFMARARSLVVVVCSIALLVLAGWLFDLDFFKRPLPHMVAMNPTTACLFILSGLSLLLLKSRNNNRGYLVPGFFFAGLVIAVSLICILDYIFKLNLGTDRILFSGKLEKDALENIYNRMAPNTCVCFLLSGFAILFLHLEKQRKKLPSQYLVILVLLLSLFSILGYMYNVPALYGIQSFIPMALHTAVCFLLLSLALLFCNPSKGIMKFLTGKLIGSSTTRLLMPYAVIIPALLGLFSQMGHRSGYYDAGFASAILVLSIVIVFAFIIWYNALLLNKRDLQRKRVEAEVKRFNEDLEGQVQEKTAEIVAIFNRLTDGFIALDRNFCYSFANRKIGELVRRDPRSLIGKNIWEEFPDAVGSETYHSFQQAMKEQRYMVSSDYYAPLELWQENHIYPSPDGLTVFIRDITEHKKAEEAVKALEHEIMEQKIQAQKKISRAIIRAQEEEKNHIGKELHDNVNQILASTKLYLGVAANKNKEVKESLQYPIQLIDSSIEEIRLLSKKQVTPLRNIDLKDLLRGVLETMEKANIVKTSFTYTVREESIPDELKLNIYRIVQGQITNIIRHAAAKQVSVSISESRGIIEIITRDDGKGFDPEAPRTGIGISNMINRVESFNGKVAIISSKGNGCTIQITIPL